MFNKRNKLRHEVKKIKEVLVGVDTNQNSFETPAVYSALYKLEHIRDQQDRNDIIMELLLDELGLSLEEGMKLVKKKKGK